MKNHKSWLSGFSELLYKRNITPKISDGGSLGWEEVLPVGVAGVGGGFKSLLVEDRTNAYAVASSWLGSGFGIQMGSSFYF